MHSRSWYMCLALPVSLYLGGCGGLQLESSPSRSIPLSGTWLVDRASSDDVGSAMRPDGRRGDDRLSTRAEIERIRRGSGLAFVAYDFQVLEARRMTIELANDSMGVKHEPGVYRDVSWGERERGIWEVQAGWEEDVLVVASRTNGISVVERYQLLAPNLLQVTLHIRADGNKRQVQRYFRRQR
jgi:hypothetical protein